MLNVDLELVRRYDVPAPRYTSYPTAPHFREDTPAADLLAHVDAANADGAAPLSLYVHLPFCESLCWFCGCTTVITTDHARASRYLDLLEAEMDLAVQRLHPARRVVQVHYGGGSPTFLRPEELARLGRALRARFRIAGDAEMGVEIDPRRLSAAQIDALADAGFTRASLGVQDLDPAVQAAVHRVQPRELTAQAVAWLRERGFTSVNIDLIYGLPLQTPSGFAATLASVLELKPDRLAVFNYAHVPWMRPAQRILERAGLPSPETKLEMLKLVVETLTGAGYDYIGMDHFALPGDEMAVARRAGTLTRNFQGYTTRAGAEILGFGMSSVSQTARSYRQNHRELDAYAAAVEAGAWPIARGVVLTDDDVRRRALIRAVLCDLRVDHAAFAAEHGVDPRTAYPDALAQLAPLELDGLVVTGPGGFAVTDRGRLFLRNIAACFDAYLRDGAPKRFSRAV